MLSAATYTAYKIERVLPHHITAAFQQVDSLTLMKAEKLADVIFAHQANPLGSLLVLPRFGVSHQELDVALKVILLCFEAVRATGFAIRTITKDEQEECLARLGCIRDITQVKQIEKAFRRGQIRAKLAAESSHIGIWELDLLTGELFWDEAMLTLYGISRAEFNGTYEDWANRLHPEDKSRNEALFSSALAELEKNMRRNLG